VDREPQEKIRFRWGDAVTPQTSTCGIGGGDGIKSGKHGRTMRSFKGRAKKKRDGGLGSLPPWGCAPIMPRRPKTWKGAGKACPTTVAFNMGFGGPDRPGLRDSNQRTRFCASAGVSATPPKKPRKKGGVNPPEIVRVRESGGLGGG